MDGVENIITYLEHGSCRKKLADCVLRNFDAPRIHELDQSVHRRWRNALQFDSMHFGFFKATGEHRFEIWTSCCEDYPVCMEQFRTYF